MNRNTLHAVLAFALLAGCAGAIGETLVEGGGPELVKLRAGPGLGYRIIMGLPDGTPLQHHACVTEVGQLWCRVSLAAAPQVVGYVSADYLSGL
jgi:uncharacterized protein YraI